MHSVPIQEDISAALHVLDNHKLPPLEVGIILGSGLAHVADALENPLIIPTKELPGYPASTAPGHKGRLVIGTYESKQVLIVQGRIHVYEGYTPEQATFPVRLMAACGIKKLIITNAAGGINASYSPGTLMLIRSHIDATHRFPDILHEIGYPLPLEDEAYDVAWRTRVLEEAAQLPYTIQEGTYVWTKGPSYETKAEIIAFRHFGADAVGMSTVPEARQAHASGMQVIGVSTITNMAAGMTAEVLKHEDVLEVGKQARDRIEPLLQIILQKA